MSSLSTQIGYYPILTFLVFFSILITAKGSEFLLSRYTKFYPALSIENQKSFVTYIYLLIFTTVCLIGQLISTSVLVGSLEPQGLILSRLASVIVSACYLYEMISRPKMNISMILHHLFTIFVIMLVTACIELLQSKALIQVAYVWLFQATAEQPNFIALMMYRLKIHPKYTVPALYTAAIQASMFKVGTAIYIIYLWGTQIVQIKTTTAIVMDVFLILILSSLMPTQIYGSYVIIVIAKSYKKKYAAEFGESTLESDMTKEIEFP